MVAAGLLCGLSLGTAAGTFVVPGLAQAAPEQRVDLNSASADDLASLPGIGPAKAAAIVEYRAKQPFATTEELMQVQGIGAKLFDQLRDHVTVGAAKVSGKPAQQAR
jgi:competence protein ComEA